MEQVLLLVISGTVLTLVGIAVSIAMVTKLVQKRAQRAIDDRFSPADVVHSQSMANCFGFTSKGPLRKKGNGGLVLTRDRLVFLPLVGDEWSLPLEKLTRAEVVKSHLGKTVGRPLLKLSWEGDDVAFYVPDVDAWLARLRR